jgi:signal transduction histidine kinase
MARVLIVDDEHSMRFTLKEFLSSEGHKVATAEDVQAAHTLLEQNDYDVLVADIILPGPSGIELLRMVREMKKSVRVILMTGAPTVEAAADAVRSGATDYLVKPISKLDITRAVNLATREKDLEDLRVTLQEEDRVHHEQLEALVQKRTRELLEANCRLSTAMEELKRTQMRMIEHERLNALGKMASGIAHDFNNILMPLLGYSELLLSEAASTMSPQDKDLALRNIHEAACEAKEVVRRLRELYRPRETTPLQAVNVKSLLERVARLTEPAWKTQAQVEGRPIKVVVAADKSFAVTGNDTALGEALTNLVLNSVDAMPSGGTITLAAGMEAHRVAISVTDTGTGMTEEVRLRCMDPFFSTKGDRGTGIGLSICHGVIQRYDGLIDVTSSPGKGTTIRIRMPAAKNDAVRDQNMAPKAPGRKWGRILIVDDDDKTRTALSMYLKGRADEVVLASSGRQGIDLITQQQFDVVITDRAMPDINGDEVAKAVKASSPATPVVMLTGLGDIMKTSADAPEGVNTVLSKPITAVELLDALQTIPGKGWDGVGRGSQRPNG